jgi:hypothetical protein
MVLGVTPVIFSKFGVVAHPDKMHDTKRIDTNERMTAPNARNKGACLPSMDHDRCIARATDGEFRSTRIVSVLVAPLQHTEGVRYHQIGP